MSSEQKRTQPLYNEISASEIGNSYRRLTNTISFKVPQVEQTIAEWKPAKTRKSFKQRCTRWETGGFCMTNIAIIIVAILFCYNIPPNLFSSNDSSVHKPKLGGNPWRMLVFCLGLTSSSMSLLCLWLTYITDPGVIPRYGDIDRMLERGERICDTCKIIRPARAKHCKHCNHCVEVFDHHCPYTGVCIGKGNYLFFCLLLLSGMISATYVCIFSIWFIKEKWPVDDNVGGPLIIGILLTIVCIILFLLIGQLSCYHVFIVVKGKTTNEWVLNRRKKKSVKKSRKMLKTITPSQEPLLGPRLSQETSSWDTATYSVTEAKESCTPLNNETSAGESRFADL